MAYQYVWIDGERVEVNVAANFARLNLAFRAAFPGLYLIISSGTRTRAEQQELYDAYLRGGPLAAPPGSSNHEENGPAGPRALDVRDSGADAGVTVKGTVRANWLRANAPRFGFNPAGYSFSRIEPWHIEFTGALAAPASLIEPLASIGISYVTKLQIALGVNPDGEVGPATISALQRKVGAVVDGIWGPGTIRALQKFVGAVVDGFWGNETATKLKAAIDAGRFGATGNIGVDLGSVYVRKLQTQLGVDPDGEVGPITITALQRKIGTPADGVWGPASVKALQEFVGATVDGIFGNGTLAAFKAAIDATKFRTTSTDPEPQEPEIPAGTVYGIDVAYPQTGTFDWAAVKAKYAFAIIKAAGAEDGIYGPADLLDKHLAGVRSVGMRAGFYFFNNNRHPIKVQADKFIEVLRSRIRPGDIVALDIENVGSQPVQFSPAQALEFAGYVEAALGVKTFMYLNRSTVNGADWSAVVAAGHPLWLATLDGLANGVTYLNAGSVRGWGRASIVQFSSATPIAGYPHGPVDQNIGFAADLAAHQFEAFPEPVPDPDPEPEPEPDPDATPSWFRRFLEGLVDFLRRFLSS